MGQSAPIGAGRLNTTIFQSLVVSTRAVKKQVANLFMKLDLPADSDQHHRRVTAVVLGSHRVDRAVDVSTTTGRCAATTLRPTHVSR